MRLRSAISADLKIPHRLPRGPADFIGMFDPVGRFVDSESQNGREHRGEREQPDAADGQNDPGTTRPVSPQAVDRIRQAREKRRGHPDYLRGAVMAVEPKRESMTTP